MTTVVENYMTQGETTMKGDKLIQLLEGVSTKDLENLIAMKGKLGPLEKKREALLR